MQSRESVSWPAIFFYIPHIRYIHVKFAAQSKIHIPAYFSPVHPHSQVFICKCIGHTTYRCTVYVLYTVKKGSRFSRPQTGCHLPNSPWPGIIQLFPPRESLVSDIPAEDGKISNLFYSVWMQPVARWIYCRPLCDLPAILHVWICQIYVPPHQSTQNPILIPHHC
jgi:hypothetical protein